MQALFKENLLMKFATVMKRREELVSLQHLFISQIFGGKHVNPNLSLTTLWLFRSWCLLHHHDAEPVMIMIAEPVMIMIAVLFQRSMLKPYFVPKEWNNVAVVLGNIRKIRWYGIAIKYLSITVLLLYNFISILQIYGYICTPVHQQSHYMFSCQTRGNPQAKICLKQLVIRKCILTFTIQVGWYV